MANLVIDQLHQAYLSNSDVEAQRAWLMSLYHGNRFALGMAAWHLSFVAWPRLPVLDQQLLAVSGQLPGNTTASRYAQREIVKRSFPKLAALPLDHNDFRVTPLLASPVRKKLTLFNKTRQRWWRLQQRLGRDRRYYYRNFDINRPALQALRQRADAYRDKFSDIWDLSALQSLMPAQPKIPIQTDVILETKRCLTLTGALLWAGRNQ
ncbi:MAG: hypothetical protein AAGF66_12390 [Cyanobacteria bacterium P01_H01_bin.119]